ncbi:DUF2975 domain-containing protein [Mucilaginibacter sp. UR6-1]|uniref:DUF2975 domain-containing protein n=1 Tax=Mucilaginibacter sp. UR6-1 TaxID=1435643 RepID=UPI001E294330|nr:DUF2975 domain-containing protein [Mucilaginibacter sp. UR6-1]MCC8407834.1 DUF2975 domain-containing protein [Mucilaginibacter sp. UR6-1]
MKTVRLIAKILSAISKILAAGYFLSFLLSVIALSTGWCLNLIEHNNRFEICYPFTRTPYLLGEYNEGYIIMFLLLLGLYALFFFLVGKVFSVFTKPRLFTAYGIRQLKMFYLGNLVLPALSVIIISVFYNIESPAEILVVLHMLLGVFTYFMAAIFKEGYHLQTENDLIL